MEPKKTKKPPHTTIIRYFALSVLMDASNGSSLPINGFYASQAFQRVLDNPIRSLNEKDMTS